MRGACAGDSLWGVGRRRVVLAGAARVADGVVLHVGCFGEGFKECLGRLQGELGG